MSSSDPRIDASLSLTREEWQLLRDMLRTVRGDYLRALRMTRRDAAVKRALFRERAQWTRHMLREVDRVLADEKNKCVGPFCTRCGECVACDLRPCRDGMAHTLIDPRD